MTPKEIAAADVTDPDVFQREIAEPCRPVVIRGLVSSWPAVRAAAQSANDFKDYLSRFDAAGEVEVFVGEPQIEGKYYYGADLNGFNFGRARMRFADALDRIVSTSGRVG